MTFGDMDFLTKAGKGFPEEEDDADVIDMAEKEEYDDQPE